MKKENPRSCIPKRICASVNICKRAKEAHTPRSTQGLKRPAADRRIHGDLDIIVRTGCDLETRTVFLHNEKSVPSSSVLGSGFIEPFFHCHVAKRILCDTTMWRFTSVFSDPPSALPLEQPLQNSIPKHLRSSKLCPMSDYACHAPHN